MTHNSSVQKGAGIQTINVAPDLLPFVQHCELRQSVA
jgi:hypothetical protein